MNKYKQIPDKIIDLHGYTTQEAEQELIHLLKKESMYKHIRIITGTGVNRGSQPVLREFIKNILRARSIRFNRAKQENGGDGVLEVFL